MGNQVTTFQVPKRNDRLVFDGLKEAFAQAGYEPNNITVNLIIGQQFNYENNGHKTLVEEVLNQETIAVRSFVFPFEHGGNVTVNRYIDKNQPQEWYDNVSVSPGSETNYLKVVKLIKEVRRCLHAIEDKAALDFLADEQRRYYEAREVTLQRQEQVLQQFFVDMQRFSTDLTQELTLDFQQKQKELEEEHTKRRAALEDECQGRNKQLGEREAALEERKKEIDDRESRHVRREIYKEIRNKFIERSKKFELTEGTKKLRRPIYISTIVLFLLLLAGSIYYVFVDSPWGGQNDPWVLGLAIARQVVLTVGLGLTAWFIIRWQNQWFHDHAAEEFKLKRLELDIDRASWVVEMAMEWKDVKGTEIPEALVERLSRNLFGDDEAKGAVPTPAETVAAAMLRSANGTKIKLGDMLELSFDPKGIKKLDREIEV